MDPIDIVLGGKRGGKPGGGVSYVELETLFDISTDDEATKEIQLSASDIEKLEALGAGPALFAIKLGSGDSYMATLIHSGITMIQPGDTPDSMAIMHLIELIGTSQLVLTGVNGAWMAQIEY